MRHQVHLGAVVVVTVISLWGSLLSEALGQQQPQQRSTYPSPAPSAYAPIAATRPASAPAVALKPEEVEQVVAPIALYPDSLLAQVLMASTYPLEIVQAERWLKQNPTLKDVPAELNKLTWAPSVKSLLDFPQVLTMMSEKLDWTVKLGDAFIADQKSVMDAVQRLRSKAYASGNLKNTSEQKVTVQAATQPAGGTATVQSSSSPAQVIVVESSNPSVVYVPTYNPTVVYGGWPYPSYPPYSYYPPGYVAGTAMLSFGVGMAVGAAWGHAWGGCNWGSSEVDVDINRNVNFNNNIDREAARADRDARQGDRQGNRDSRQTGRQGGGSASSFQHDPSHRQGVAYRDSATTERFKGQQASQRTAQAREQYRGRTQTGSANSFQGGANNARNGSGSFNTPRSVNSGGTQSSGSRNTGFGGANSSGSTARSESARGQSSRSSPTYSRSSGGGGSSGGSRSSGGGGARSSGGGSRGGGGGGRGGGRR